MQKQKGKNKPHLLRIAAKDVALFNAIKSGKKKVETRVASVKYERLQVGDEVIFCCDGKKTQKKITTLCHFKTIASLLRKYKPSMINPSLATAKDIKAMYYSFSGYKEKIAEFGLIAFELE
ncbi:MAG TPA: ASCH domain-containing protein [Candidatus Paceibacterota bacterium]|nr:ASCH domain-containing protein [Candidatus Paceibacterota bacterium]